MTPEEMQSDEEARQELMARIKNLVSSEDELPEWMEEAHDYVSVVSKTWSSDEIVNVGPLRPAPDMEARWDAILRGDPDGPTLADIDPATKRRPRLE